MLPQSINVISMMRGTVPSVALVVDPSRARVGVSGAFATPFWLWRSVGRSPLSSPLNLGETGVSCASPSGGHRRIAVLGRAVAVYVVELPAICQPTVGYSVEMVLGPGTRKRRGPLKLKRRDEPALRCEPVSASVLSRLRSNVEFRYANSRAVAQNALQISGTRTHSPSRGL